MSFVVKFFNKKEQKDKHKFTKKNTNFCYMYIIKKISPAVILGFFFFLFFAGCDIIDPPYITDHEGNNGNGEDIRKVLLEEFTGHQCPNCPEGSRVAKELSDFYGDRLVIMSIHAGFFAEPSASPFGYDFRTEEGEDLHDFFGVSSYPTGMINRKSFDGSRLISPSAWGEAISQIIDLETDLRIDISLHHDSNTKQLEVNLNVHALKGLENQYYISAFITENKIIKPQRTNNPDYPDGVIEEYEHNHVLRKSINTTWGEQLNEEPILSGDLFSKSYSVSLDDEWVAENCAVIAFVYDEDSLEILQVEEMPLTR